MKGWGSEPFEGLRIKANFSPILLPLKIVFLKAQFPLQILKKSLLKPERSLVLGQNCCSN